MKTMLIQTAQYTPGVEQWTMSSECGIAGCNWGTQWYWKYR